MICLDLLTHCCITATACRDIKSQALDWLTLIKYTVSSPPPPWSAAHLFLYQTSFRAFVIKQLVCWALMLVIIFFFHDSLGCPSSYHTSIGIAFHPYFLFIHKTCLSHLFSFPILSITHSSASIILPISLFDVSYSFDFLALLCPFLELIIYFFSIFYCPQLWTDSTSVFSIYF